jgi:hypothetical protein
MNKIKLIGLNEMFNKKIGITMSTNLTFKLSSALKDITICSNRQPCESVNEKIDWSLGYYSHKIF